MAEEKLTWQVLNTWKLHQLLSLALSDFDQFCVSPGCRVDMGTYLIDWTGTEGCAGCLAGSVLAQTFGYKAMAEYNATVDMRDRAESRHWMVAIDYMRVGRVRNALEFLKREETTFNLDRRVVDYHNDPSIWRAEMDLLLTDLRKYDL